MCSLIVLALLLVSCALTVVEDEVINGEEEAVATPVEEPITQPLPEPATFLVSNLNIQPLEVEPIEPVNIPISVVNTGGSL